MRKQWFWVALLLFAAALRLPAPDWDGGISAHPDELYLLDAAGRVAPWGDICTAVPQFPYGHLPVYLATALIRAAPGADPLYAARLLSGLIGVLLVALAGAWGRQLGGDRGGLLAAALLAVAPFPLQQARFYTVDPLAAVCTATALLAAVRRRWGAAGALTGLAVACKVTAGWVLVPVLVAAWLSDDLHALRFTLHVSRFVFHGLQVALAGAAAFALVSPWALLRPVACWEGPLIQLGVVAGRWDFPYTRQYAGTLPYLYPLAQLALWGLGPGVVVAGLGGLGAALVHWRRLPLAARVAAIWMGLFFAVTAGLYVKFPRYLLPIYPLWVAWAARATPDHGPWTTRNKPVWSVVCRLWSLAVIALTALPGIAQLTLYARPHPWVTASRWLYVNLPPGSTIAVEAWDYPLPVSLPEGDVSRYRQITLPVMDEESPEKAAALAAALREADAIVLASPRGYGALARQPERYAGTLAWYRTLLTAPGWETVAFGRCPRLGPLPLSDDPLADAGLPAPLTLAARCGAPYVLRLPRLDESFRVYDAPAVLVLVRRSASWKIQGLLTPRHQDARKALQNLAGLVASREIFVPPPVNAGAW